MTPYYQDDYVTIYHGDALEILRSGEISDVDAVITDPPYCSGAHESAKRSKRNHTTPESIIERPTIQFDSMGSLGFEWTFRRWAVLVRSIVRPGGHMASFIDWRMFPQLSILVEAGGWRLTNMLVWDKGYAGLGNGFRAQHELVLLSSNGPPSWYSYEYGNVLQHNRITTAGERHPHEKPDKLIRAIVETCTPKGGTVLDTFLGGGPTLQAAKDLGRKAIGIEIEERYCEIAAERCSQEVLPL